MSIKTMPFRPMFVEEFDSEWANKYSIMCGTMIGRIYGFGDNAGIQYGSAYRLCEFLWKLKVWKP